MFFFLNFQDRQLPAILLYPVRSLLVDLNDILISAPGDIYSEQKTALCVFSTHFTLTRGLPVKPCLITPTKNKLCFQSLCNVMKKVDTRTKDRQRM